MNFYYLFVMYIIYNNLTKTLTIISNLNKKNTELKGKFQTQYLNK